MCHLGNVKFSLNSKATFRKEKGIKVAREVEKIGVFSLVNN